MATRTREPTAGDVADEAIDRLRDIEAAAQAQIRAILARLDTQRGSDRLLTDAQAKRNAETVLRQVRQEIDRLQAAARDEAQASVLQAMEAEHARVNPDQPFDANARQRILDAVADRFAELDDVFGEARREVARAVRVASTTSAPLGGLMQDVADALETTVGRARSAVDSATMASGRLATVEDAEAASEATGVEQLYIYSGPADAVTREFCRDHLTTLTGAVYAASYFERADNGDSQPKPVLAYLGGYNCRHSLAPITRAEAERRGYRIVE